MVDDTMIAVRYMKGGLDLINKSKQVYTLKDQITQLNE